MNVYCPTTNNYEYFVMQMAQKLRKYINCDIIQISQIVNENRVDLSIGMQSDSEAIMFLLKNQDIKIDTDKYGEQTYKPIVSNVFKIYMNSKKHLYAQMIADQQKQEAKRKQLEQMNKNIFPKQEKLDFSISPSQKSNLSGSRSYSSESNSRSESGSENSHQRINKFGYENKRKQGQQRQRSRNRLTGSRPQNQQNKYGSQVIQVPNIYQICVFCVPLDYDERDVEDKLKQKRILTLYNTSVWKMSEDMQYLEIRLQRPLSIEEINSIDLKIHNFPCIVMQKPKNQVQLRQEIRRYQSQLISQTPFNEKLLLQVLVEVGGVVSVIKDDYFDQEKYIVTFNMLSKVKKFEKKCKEIISSKLQFSHPQEYIRMCRLEKNFSINHVINDYAEKMRRNI